ncbi:DUF4153 domain-containing protein [Sporosarcina sp. FA9]|uniref:DUF4153 domain-containing protein n=1 Tax=Sporosarcina sp. FA9 TaxID=3413030 RepID=UPI003F656429
MVVNIIKSLKEKLKGLIHATNRYPLTMLFLIASAVMSAISINHESEFYLKLLLTFLIGSLFSAVAQQLYERFLIKASERVMLMIGAVLLTAVYYFAIQPSEYFNIETGTKTGIAIFALIMAFIWIPTIKSKVTFNEAFMSAFKAFFITLLYTLVIAGGLSLIIFAVDNLLFSVNDKTIPHILSIVFTLFSPIFFLSFTPLFLGKKDETLTTKELMQREERIENAISYPNNLRILISYIIIPLTTVYTIILLAYVLLNLGGDFWTKNLLEPLLVSYAVTVIIVYILSSELENKFASLFRKIFPKVLIPIVLFQTIASILKINEMGITYGRYYVILFGFFAIVAGSVFSFMPVRKNGVIVIVLIILSAISITPPIDGFTVSRVNQTNLLESTLIENNMLVNDKVISNANASIEDKKLITNTVRYLNNMDYAKDITWLPNDVLNYNKFEKTFGFAETYDQIDGSQNQGQFFSLNWDSNPIVNVEEFDRMVHMYLNNPQNVTKFQSIQIEIDGLNYTLQEKQEGDDVSIHLVNENNEELIQFDTMNIYKTILEKNDLKTLTTEEATIIEENDKVKMSILANSINVYDSQYNADIYIFIKIK